MKLLSVDGNFSRPPLSTFFTPLPYFVDAINGQSLGFVSGYWRSHGGGTGITPPIRRGNCHEICAKPVRSGGRGLGVVSCTNELETTIFAHQDFWGRKCRCPLFWNLGYATGSGVWLLGKTRTISLSRKCDLAIHENLLGLMQTNIDLLYVGFHNFFNSLNSLSVKQNNPSCFLFKIILFIYLHIHIAYACFKH